MFLLTYFHTVIFWAFILLADGGFVFNNETEADDSSLLPLVTLRQIVFSGVTVIGTNANENNTAESGRVLKVKNAKKSRKKLKTTIKGSFNGSEGSEDIGKVQRQATTSTTTAAPATTRCMVFELLEGVGEFSKGVLKFIALGVPEEDEE